MNENMKEEKSSGLKEEALKLMTDVIDSTKHVSALVKNIYNKIDNNNFSVVDGISLLDVKAHLLLSYLTDLAYLMTLKSSGRSIEEDPAIDRLIEGRVVIERIRPIDQKLKYQIDKLLKIASTGTLEADDPSRFRANPANMMSKFENEEESDDGDDDQGNAGEGKEATKIGRRKPGTYVPPKVAPAYYEGDETKAEREQRLLERARKFALNSSIVQELKEEYLDTPTEVKSTNSLTQKLDMYEKRKQEYEETYFTRLPVTKADKQRKKKISTLGPLGEELVKFEDISALEGTMPVLKSSKKRKGKSQGRNKGKKKKRFH